MNINYKEKYLKYKSKYLNLQLLTDSSKKYLQTGGNNHQEKINKFINDITIVQNRLNEDKNIINNIIKLLKELTYATNNVINLFSKTNINKIIEINKYIRELVVKYNREIDLKNCIHDWFELLEVLYYSHVIKLIPMYEQCKDKEDAKSVNTKILCYLFKDLWPSIQNLSNLYGWEDGLRSEWEYDKIYRLLV